MTPGRRRALVAAVLSCVWIRVGVVTADEPLALPASETERSSFRLAQPDALLELRHVYTEAGVPPQPEQWEPWAEPDGKLRFLLRHPRVEVADVDGINLYRSVLVPDGYACTIHLRPSAWPKALALSEHPGDRSLMLLWRGKPLARGVSLLGHAAAVELAAGAATNLRAGLAVAPDRETETDGVKDLEFQRWLEAQVRAGRQPLTARLLLAASYRQWRDCDEAGRLLDGVPAQEPFAGARYTVIHLFNQVADCYAEQEDYARAAGVSQRLRALLLRPAIVDEPDLSLELQSWADLIDAEVAGIRVTNIDPVALASTYLFSQSGRLGRATDCQRAARLIDRLLERAIHDPGLADRQLELIAACSVARGDRQTALEIAERVAASSLDGKEALVARVRELVGAATVTASTPAASRTNGL